MSTHIAANYIAPSLRSGQVSLLQDAHLRVLPSQGFHLYCLTYFNSSSRQQLMTAAAFVSRWVPQRSNFSPFNKRHPVMWNTPDTFKVQSPLWTRARESVSHSPVYNGNTPTSEKVCRPARQSARQLARKRAGERANESSKLKR